MCMHQLILHPNLKHAIERVERPNGSHKGVGRKKQRASMHELPEAITVLLVDFRVRMLSDQTVSLVILSCC